MADATISRTGLPDGGIAGQEKDLFLTEFGGMILNKFNETTIMNALHQTVTISGAKEFTFPVTGHETAAYHTPGTELLGNQSAHGERKITVDDRLLSHKYIDDIDKLMSYYDVRSIYAGQMGQALAKIFDQHVMLEIIAAAFTAAGSGIDDADGGYKFYGGATSFSSTTLATRVETFMAGLRDTLQNFDEKNVDDNFNCIIKPQMYWDLLDYSKTVATSGLINVDLGGSGSISQGKVGPLFGVNLLRSNLLPQADYSSDTGNFKFHKVDASDVHGIIFSRDAVATVKLMDMNVEESWIPDKRSHLLVAEYIMGHGVLRPECAAVLLDGASA